MPGLTWTRSTRPASGSAIASVTSAARPSGSIHVDAGASRNASTKNAASSARKGEAGSRRRSSACAVVVSVMAGRLMPTYGRATRRIAPQPSTTSVVRVLGVEHPDPTARLLLLGRAPELLVEHGHV